MTDSTDAPEYKDDAWATHFLEILWKENVWYAINILLESNRNIAQTNAKMLSPITNTKITYLSKNAGDKEESFLFNKKAAVVNAVVTIEIKLRLLSTTLIHQPNLFNLTSEDAQTPYGTHY